MKALLEATSFGLLAVALHAAALLISDRAGGSQSGGAGGTALISLSGSSPQVAETLSKWETPPPASQTITALPPPNTADAPPVPAMPQAPTATALAKSDPSNLAAPALPSGPSVDTATFTPPPAPSPSPKTKAAPEKTPLTKATTAATPSAAAASQKAAGSGGASQAGTATTSAIATLSPARKATLTSQWGARIRAKIERQKRFPRGAQGDGRVIIRLTLSREGQLIQSGIARSSGVAAFDKAALRAVSSVRRFPTAPQGLTRESYSFDVPISFLR